MLGNTAALTCPECDAAKLRKEHSDLAGSIREESFTVKTKALVCPNCGFKTIAKESMGQFALLIADAYRTAHNLLTSAELVKRRRSLEMTQERFAKYIGVGIASLKRWELGQIQDKPLDELIRLKTDIAAARSNLQILESRVMKGQPLSSDPRADVGVERFSKTL